MCLLTLPLLSATSFCQSCNWISKESELFFWRYSELHCLYCTTLQKRNLDQLSVMTKSPGFLFKIWSFMHNLCSYTFWVLPLTVCPTRTTDLLICKSRSVPAWCLLCTHVDNLCLQTCSKCQMRRKCTKSFTIQKFPKILVLRILCYLDFYWPHEWTAVALYMYV